MYYLNITLTNLKLFVRHREVFVMVWLGSGDASGKCIRHLAVFGAVVNARWAAVKSKKLLFVQVVVHRSFLVAILHVQYSEMAKAQDSDLYDGKRAFIYL